MKGCARSVAPRASSVMAQVWPHRRGLADEEANGPPDWGGGDNLCEVSPHMTFVDYILLALS